MPSFPYYTEPTHDQGAVATAGRDTAIQSAESRLIVDAVDKIFLLEPNKHPLVTLMTNVGKVYDGASWKGSSIMKAPAGNFEFDWFEDYYGGRYAKVSGTYSASGALTITVTGAGSSSAYIFTVGDIFMNARTGERMIVATIGSSTTITVASGGRAFGSTAAAAGVDGDELYIVGNASEENAGARNINTTRSQKQYNYTQIFKKTIGISGTAAETNTYGGSDMKYQRAKVGTEHALDIERAFWFGERKTTTGTNGHPLRSTGGIHEFITTGGSYVQNQSGPITAPDLNSFLREGFTYGNDEKMLFAGGIVLQAITEISRGQLQTKVGDTTYGVAIQQWITPFGKINIVHNPLFTGSLAGSAYLLDMESFRYRYIQNRDTRLLTNVQAPDVDGTIDQYITEAGLERKQAPRNALLKGVTI